MVEELANILPGFPGESARTRCFAHIINLVAKSLLKQFDSPGKPNQSSGLSQIEEEMDRLEVDLEYEETQTQLEARDEIDEGDDDDGWVDEVAKLTGGEREDLRKSVVPVRVVLVKVGFIMTHLT